MDFLSTPLLEQHDVDAIVESLSFDSTLWRDGSLTAGEFAGLNFTPRQMGMAHCHTAGADTASFLDASCG